MEYVRSLRCSLVAGRASAQAAQETRRAILHAAAELTSLEGLDSISIGRLADSLSMSKSGVIGQFGSREQLQLATVQAVFDVFIERIWMPVRDLTPGLPRLLALIEAWVDHAAAPPYAGGCAVAQMTYDFDDRPGAVRDLLAEGRTAWRQRLAKEITRAREAGDLPDHIDSEQAAFAINAVVTGITPARALDGDVPVRAWAVVAIRALLGLPPD